MTEQSKQSLTLRPHSAQSRESPSVICAAASSIWDPKMTLLSRNYEALAQIPD